MKVLELLLIYIVAGSDEDESDRLRFVNCGRDRLPLVYPIA
jgi:hypothetical protein